MAMPPRGPVASDSQVDGSERVAQTGDLSGTATERKTGLEPAIRALRTLRVRDGSLDLLRRAA